MSDKPVESTSEPKGLIVKFLDFVEWLGNKLPDPAVLFVIGLIVVWIASALFAGEYTIKIDSPKTQESAKVEARTTQASVAALQDKKKDDSKKETESQSKSKESSTEKSDSKKSDSEKTSDKKPEEAGVYKVKIENLFTLEKFAAFLSSMVNEFVMFPPLGVVLVALLGVGVAEQSGFLNACLKSLLNLTPQKLLTPMLIFVAIISHTAADAGYVLVIPIGGVMFYAAGRHPLAGIAAAFAGVSGGFSANFIPSGIDPLLAGLTQVGANVENPEYAVNPLCNWFFTSASCLVIILLGWFLTDKIVEPRLKGTKVDGDPKEMPQMPDLSDKDRFGMICGLISIGVGILLLVLWAIPESSSLRATNGSLTSYKPKAPLMDSIVPLIFILFVIPGIVHGYASGTFKNHRDIIKGMTKAMETMGYYLVLIFFAALFIKAFKDSHFANLLAYSGAKFIIESGAPPWLTILAMIGLTAFFNLFIGSASAKWTMLSVIFVPMLMIAELSPELTQAAYRVGDSTTNIITPMMPYFPLVVVFCQRYVKKTGIGTLAAMMLPYSLTFLVCWSIFLIIYWMLGIPLGLQAPYEYTPPAP